MKVGPTFGQGSTDHPSDPEDQRSEYVSFALVHLLGTLSLTLREARSLDENLQTREGPVRNFMILARYCSKTVLQEQVEIIHQTGSILWPSNFFWLLGAWASFVRVEVKLSLYEYYISFRRFTRLPPIINM